MDGNALLFMHIPKTAGTSLLRVLDQVYTKSDRIHLYDLQPDATHPNAFRDVPLDQRVRLRLVVGHFRYGIHKLVPQRSRYATMVRDPVDRLLSLYHHYRNWPQAGDLHRWIIDNDISFEEFVFSGRTTQTDNDMVRFISGVDAGFGRCGEAMLDTALGHISDDFDAVLVQEEMERSMAVLQRLLRAKLPQITWENVNPMRVSKDSLERSVVTRVEELNWLDLKLHRSARESLVE